MSLKGAVEAALFAAGGPIPVRDLAQIVGSPAEEVEEMLAGLRAEYKSREGGVEIVRHAGGIWVLQVNQQYTALVQRLVPPDLEMPLMKTLSLVALLQPVTQAKIVEHRGQGAYTHVKELEKRGFVTREPSGNSFLLRTTPDFARRFRLKDDPEAIRTALQERAANAVAVPEAFEPVAEPAPDVVAPLLEAVERAAQELQNLAPEAPVGTETLATETLVSETPVVEASVADETPADLDEVAMDVEIPEVPMVDMVDNPLAFTPRPVPAGAPVELAADEAPASNVSRLADHQSLRHRILEGRDKAAAWPVRRARR